MGLGVSKRNNGAVPTGSVGQAPTRIIRHMRLNFLSYEVRSGQLDAGEGFEHWILKFDGVSGNRDKELEDPQDYGAIEYAYSRMAKDAGIMMSECRLFEENNRRHFMTRRFDRRKGGEKMHMQSLCGLAHFDYNMAGAWSYEQALLIIRQLKLPMEDIEQQFRRMVFNVIARNQDDHAKNIAFLMNIGVPQLFDRRCTYESFLNYSDAHCQRDSSAP
jgi:serine/threonine-protein kinase HipA